MKIIYQLLLLILLTLIAFSCWNCISDNNEDMIDDLSTTKNNLVGDWIEIFPCDSCRTLVFDENDTIYQKDTWYENTPLVIYYQVIAKDSILVTRNWEIESEKKTTKHKLIFHTADTLELIQFLAVDYGITGFEDIKLGKLTKP